MDDSRELDFSEEMLNIKIEIKEEKIESNEGNLSKEITFNNGNFIPEGQSLLVKNELMDISVKDDPLDINNYEKEVSDCDLKNVGSPSVRKTMSLCTIASEFYHKISDETETGKSVVYKCKMCLPKTQLIKGGKSSLSNLKKHMERVHPASLIKLKENSTVSMQKQSKDKGRSVQVSDFFRKRITQATFDEKLTDFMLQTGQCFHLLENKYFIDFAVAGREQCKIPSKMTFSNRIREEYEKLNSEVIKELMETSMVCTTADLWSTFNRSYFGVTAHWILPNLTRRAAVLACSRMQGSHTHNAIAQKLEEIHISFKIQTKVTATVTDNATNMVKAFRMFGKNDLNYIDQGGEEGEERENEQIVISNIVSEDTDTLYSLSRHERCAAHTINLIATVDSGKVTNQGYQKLSKSATSKCNALWNKVHRSCQAQEQMEKYCKKKLSVPCITHWNSYYEAVKGILELEDLNGACTTLGTPTFRSAEVEFLEEFVKVMGILARGLNIIQSEDNMYMAYLLPTIETMRSKLNSFIMSEDLKHVVPLVTAVLNGLDKRFNFDERQRRSYTLTAAVHPKFKLRWLQGERESEAKACLETEMEKLSTPQSNETSSEEEDEFFSFKKQKICETESKPRQELSNYLANNSSDIQQLHMYPLIKELFIKYNTTLPSSAPVERLFSIAGNLSPSKRSRMSDELFEKSLFVKFNKNRK